MKYTFFILLSFFIFGLAQGQSNKENLLLSKLENAKNGADKIPALNQLGIYYESVSSYSKSLDYLFQAQALNKAEKQIREAIITQNYMGYVYWHKSEYISAIYHHNKALEIAKSNQINDENVA